MDLRKAAEMALEALETLWDILDDIDTASDMAKENDAWYRKRVEALQKKRWDTMITTDGYKLKGGPVEALRQALAQPEQEQYVTKVVAVHEDGTYTTERIPLPKREWVGLMDEEIHGIYKTHHDQYGKCQTGGFEYERTIEAKLKEKNA